MSTRRWVPLTAAAMVVALGGTVGASELDRPPTLKISLLPRKAGGAGDRISEVVQKTPDFALWDAKKKTSPSSAGHMFIVVKTDRNRWLLTDLNEGQRGWAWSSTVVPLSQAETFFSQQISANPQNAFAFLMRGVVRCENDDFEHAVADLDQALKIEPNYLPALIERAYLRQWQNHLDAAIADVSKAITIDPRGAYAFVERGVFEYNKKAYNNALRDFQNALDLGARAAVIHIGRGLIYLSRRDMDKASAELKLAQEIDPRHPDAYAAIASLFLQQGKTEKALRVLDQAVEIDPDCAESRGNRAVILLAMDQYEKALDDLDILLRLAPNSARALRERARLLATCPDAKIRDGQQAVLSASKACSLSEWKDPQCLAILAAACSEAGDFDGAVRWQQEAINLLPQKSPEKREYRGLLGRYQAKKPYHRLNFFQELGLPGGPTAPKQDD